jgi:putative hydrolase of the HAD superfamily
VASGRSVAILTKSVALFDMGDTLIHGDRGRRLALRFGVGRAEAEAAVQRADRWFMSRERGAWHRGDGEFARRWAAMVTEILGLEAEVYEVAEYARPADSDWRLHAEAERVLQQLAARGYTLGLVSNWSLAGRAIAQRLGLDRYCAAMVFSAEFGAEKPAAEIFAHALRLIGAAPQAALYVGDNYWDDVIGARRAGIMPLLLDRVGRLPHPGHGDTPMIRDLNGVLAWAGPVDRARVLAVAD